jgi:hypothetical protein
MRGTNAPQPQPRSRFVTVLGDHELDVVHPRHPSGALGADDPRKVHRAAVNRREPKEIVMHDELVQALHGVQAALGDPVDQLDEKQAQIADRLLDHIEALLDALSADES